MSAIANEQIHDGPTIAAPRRGTTGSRARRRLSPELALVIQEIAESERALDDVIARSRRLHAAGIEHSPIACLVCFEAR